MSYRDRRVLVMEPARGVDYTSSALDVAAGRASDMSNMIGENGQLRKRYGWRQEAQITELDGTVPVGQRIHGMWHDGVGMWIHAGTHLYYRWEDAAHEVHTMRVDRSTGEELVLLDRDTEGFFLHGNLYIVGGGNILAVERTEDTIGISPSGFFVRVRDLADMAYIPTTTVAINDNKSEIDSRETLDDWNLLTERRKNTMIGRAWGKDAIGNDELMISYQLDGTVDLAAGVRVEIETEEMVDGRPETVIKVLETRTDGSLYLTGTDEIWGAVDEDGLISFTAETQNGAIVEGSRSIKPPVDGIDNITVEFSHAWEDGNPAGRILGAGFGCLFGADGAADRLFLGGIPGFGGRVYWSESDDWTYWPASNYHTAGSDTNPVIGFSRLSDGVLAIHTAGGRGEPSIHYMTGANSIQYADEAETVVSRITAVFRLVSGAAGEPVVSRAACLDFLGDKLILTRTGVYAVVMRENVQTQDRYLVERSRSIRVKLKATDLTGAHAVVHDGRYWLAVGGRVYVADSRATYEDESGVQYEWYVLDNVPAVSLSVIDGRLWFGTLDGRVCRFNEREDSLLPGEAYADRTENAFFDGDVTLSDQTELTVSSLRPDVKAAERLIFDSGLYERILSNPEEETDEEGEDMRIFRVEDGRIVLADADAIRHFFDGMDLVLHGYREGAELTIPVTVTDVSRFDGSFALAAGGEPVAVDEDDQLLRSLRGRELTFDVTDTGTIRLHGDSGYMDLSVIPDEAITGRAVFYNPVVCEWYSPVTDFGTNVYEKTIHRLTVATEPVENGEVSVGFETRAAAGLYGSMGISSGLDLGALSFLDFTLVGFASSYTREIMQRHVNFARFRFRSAQAQACCVHNLTITYSVVGLIRGGR